MARIPGSDGDEPKSLDALRGAIFGAVDAIASGSDADEIADPTEGLPGGEETPPSRKQPPATDDDTSESGDEGEESDEPSKEDSEGEPEPQKKEKHAPEGKEPPSTAEGEAEGADESARIQERLDAMSYNRRTAVQKFLPGGKASTLAELSDAEAQFENDYWRLQQRLSEREKESPVAKPAKEKPAEVPPDLQLFDSKIQSFEQEAKNCDAHISGWFQELQTTRAKLADLTGRRAAQDPTVDPDEIIRLHARVDQITSNIGAWRDRKANFNQAISDLQANRSLTEKMLDTRSRLERRETEDASRASVERTQAFARDWAKSYNTVVKALKIPENKQAQFRKRAADATFVHLAVNGGMKPGEVSDFLMSFGKEFKGLYEEAKAEGAASYADGKRKDAPKVPRGGGKTAAQQQRHGKKPPRPSMRELQARIMGADFD